MARTIDPNKVILPAKFAHIVLRTRHLQEAIGWYQKVVGMEVVFANPFVAFLSYDGEHHRLALVQTSVPEEAPHGAPGLDHFAYALSSLGDLFATYERLKLEGIRPIWTVNHGPTTSLYYEDPDHNRVEFQVDNFASEAELKGWMQSDAFARNPIGIEFDIEEMIARYEAGEPIAELKRQVPS